mmetsp:Transcript_17862/g.40476  ORF Transcript_17862/g.40476 Transcript_17862/m.40476 type:complete len:211 (+) Transcript_17862:995-1627(+)
MVPMTPHRRVHTATKLPLSSFPSSSSFFFSPDPSRLLRTFCSWMEETRTLRSLSTPDSFTTSLANSSSLEHDLAISSSLLASPSCPLLSSSTACSSRAVLSWKRTLTLLALLSDSIPTRMSRSSSLSWLITFRFSFIVSSLYLILSSAVALVLNKLANLPTISGSFCCSFSHISSLADSDCASRRGLADCPPSFSGASLLSPSRIIATCV